MRILVILASLLWSCMVMLSILGARAYFGHIDWLWLLGFSCFASPLVGLLFTCKSPSSTQDDLHSQKNQGALLEMARVLEMRVSNLQDNFQPVVRQAGLIERLHNDMQPLLVATKRGRVFEKHLDVLMSCLLSESYHKRWRTQPSIKVEDKLLKPDGILDLSFGSLVVESKSFSADFACEGINDMEKEQRRKIFISLFKQGVNKTAMYNRLEGCLPFVLMYVNSDQLLGVLHSDPKTCHLLSYAYDKSVWVVGPMLLELLVPYLLTLSGQVELRDLIQRDTVLVHSVINKLMVCVREMDERVSISLSKTGGVVKDLQKLQAMSRQAQDELASISGRI